MLNYFDFVLYLHNQNDNLNHIPYSYPEHNLITYLSYYKTLTDSVNIKDAFVINIGLEFEISTYKSSIIAIIAMPFNQWLLVHSWINNLLNISACLLFDSKSILLISQPISFKYDLYVEAWFSIAFPLPCSSIIFSNDGEAVILNKNNTKGILLKGYFEIDFKNLEIVKKNEFFGKKELKENSISIGKELSFILNLDIGDLVTLMSPAGVQTIVGSLPKQEVFKVSSIFDSGLANFNENVAFINLNTLENFFNKESELRFLEYYFTNPQDISEHKLALSAIHPYLNT